MFVSFIRNSTFLNKTEGGYECPIGKYCPEGTTSPRDCPAGTYSNTTGLSSCKNCPAGYYCPYGVQDYTMNPCVAGYYCPEGFKI